MREILHDVSSSSIATAFETNMCLMFRSWQRAEVHIGTDMLWVLTDIDVPFLNGIMRTQLSPDDVDNAIEAAINRGKSKHVSLDWCVGPATRPAELGESLQAHGFILESNTSAMAIDLSSLDLALPMPPGLVIEQVAEIETLRQWRRAYVAGFGAPDFVGDVFFELNSAFGLDAHSPLRHYVGWLNGEPVATSTLFLAAGVAGIYNVATIPDVRGRGIGAAMTSLPLCEAHTIGYRVGVLEASSMGASVYRRLGFQEYGRINHYVWRPVK